MKLIHTADWHLGHKFCDVDRFAEHAAFLDWLVKTICEREVDALLVCGDIFDTANPPAEVQEQWYRFLARCKRAKSSVDIIAIGGNHDAAGRLNAPNPLLKELGVQIVGGLPRCGREVIVDEVLKPITDQDGNIAAWVTAVPFLRSPDLPLVQRDDPLIEGVRQRYRKVLDAARDRAGDDCAIIAMGHLYLAGTRISELSERKVLGGNQHALPVDIFPEDVTYVALGHLHRAQTVGRENVRYPGAPLPMSMPERTYQHQVVEVVLDKAELVECEPMKVPQTRHLMRIPDTGAILMTDLLSALATLPGAEAATGEPPLLEVAVRLDRPEPGLRRQVEQALEGKHARLVALLADLTGHEKALADNQQFARLADLHPEQVFFQAWRKAFEKDPPPQALEAFHDLVDQVMQGTDR
ncbi:MAG: exonuclease SbcCD subunit D C-terminal domain-containing protein [Myxococcota bacterium]|nr:exonuclease SbcCD subunit D C-terminal domain-containing protein [Myxococcota bacterium]